MTDVVGLEGDYAVSDESEPRVMILGEIEGPKLSDLWCKVNAIGIAPSIYETLIEARWIEEMKFCGCGAPEETREWLGKVMAIIGKRRTPEWASWDEVEATIQGDKSSLTYFVLYVLDAMGLTEHGGSVGGCWLTEKGRKLLGEMGG